MPLIFGMLILKVKYIQANRIDIDVTEHARPSVSFELFPKPPQVGNVPLHCLVALILAPEVDSIVLDQWSEPQGLDTLG